MQTFPCHFDDHIYRVSSLKPNLHYVPIIGGQVICKLLLSIGMKKRLKLSNKKYRAGPILIAGPVFSKNIQKS